jgi:hypothetical protein
MAFADTSDRRHDLARRAISALEGVMIEKGGLNRVQRAVFAGNAFDRRHLTALDLGRQGKTGKNPFAIDMAGAGAALALVAALLGPGHLKMIPQRIEQGYPWLDIERMGLAIDIEAEVKCSCHDKLLLSSRDMDFAGLGCRTWMPGLGLGPEFLM